MPTAVESVRLPDCKYKKIEVLYAGRGIASGLGRVKATCLCVHKSTGRDRLRGSDFRCSEQPSSSLHSARAGGSSL